VASVVLTGCFLQWDRITYVTGHEKVWLSQFPIASSGPFKGLLTGYWWVEAQNMQAKFRFEEVEKLTKRICYLQPYNPKVWEYLSWNMSYNLSAESVQDRERQVYWLLEGLRQLRRGIDYNPKNLLLEYAFGVTVFLKTQGDFDFTPELKAFLNQEPLQFAKFRMIESKVIEYGEYIMGLHAINIYLKAADLDLAIASCHQLIKRFPEHESGLLEHIEFIKSIAKERE